VPTTERQARADWLNDNKDLFDDRDKGLASLAARRVPV
jgi:hypothetical protein